ncbi:GNAT family N-acetyltransferase [Niveibacterium sp. 24ML]|uniref:GNAT family N-acetyltransferase n=1 Tax=Niveibacterium sp. 24ML TaxID=2985512 RepID=UPI00226F2249|nr:GNAT family N-acetyltransferase [Niveibacterium sp. 24ML]MCX9155490.1 GNAT family N-acetyltransferase [Niveibacterium sp. 24ML]
MSAALAWVPIDEAAYALWRDESVAGYAEGKVEAGNWPAEGALARAEAEFASLLPHGAQTPQHHIGRLVREDGQSIATAWLRVAPEHEGAGAQILAYLYDFVIDPPWRGQGLGLAAMAAVEAWARGLGAQRLSLHVFAHNTAACRLYAKAGFVTTNLNMSKALLG